jgi:hypothetical protein
VSVIEQLQRQAAAGGRLESSTAVTDLAKIAFFFVLCVGKYTMPPANRRTRTVQFRVQDVIFYHGGLIIPDSAPLPSLLQVDGVALRIKNQKNGTRGETTYQHALPGRRILVTDLLAWCVAAVMAATGSEAAPISRLATDNNASGHASAKMIRTVVRKAVSDLGLRRQDIRAEDVGSHSLRADGTMAMKLNGCNMVQIMKAGRWTSLTFLTYIHNQIAHLGTNIGQRMATHVPFFSFGGVQ